MRWTFLGIFEPKQNNKIQKCEILKLILANFLTRGIDIFVSKNWQSGLMRLKKSSGVGWGVRNEIILARRAAGSHAAGRSPRASQP